MNWIKLSKWIMDCKTVKYEELKFDKFSRLIVSESIRVYCYVISVLLESHS